ncbi:hypothetical protein [Dyadobacter sp. 3J3]|uniref:hypothetical protein n=1 Tax=Dyadobacter sp. 3J3 TaxID=2606600 RepID=UPI00135C7B8D|nr:hypothetical protein [Dyadobacter sp. 3J3]
MSNWHKERRELMQLFVIVRIFPWLIVFSKSYYYSFIRIAGAAFSALVVSWWILERITPNSNFVTVLTQRVTNYAVWLILLLALGVMISRFSVLVSKLN